VWRLLCSSWLAPAAAKATERGEDSISATSKNRRGSVVLTLATFAAEAGRLSGEGDRRSVDWPLLQRYLKAGLPAPVRAQEGALGEKSEESIWSKVRRARRGPPGGGAYKRRRDSQRCLVEDWGGEFRRRRKRLRILNLITEHRKGEPRENGLKVRFRIHLFCSKQKRQNLRRLSLK